MGEKSAGQAGTTQPDAGQMIFLALRAGSPEYSERIPVVLTVDESSDGWAQRQSVTALRQRKIERLAREAEAQGALLTQEELARLVCCSRATVKRDIAYLRVAGSSVPTISRMDDLGRGISLKTRIVRDWLLGESFDKLRVKHGRSVAFIQRCCDDFVRLAHLSGSGAREEALSQELSLPRRLVREYLALYHASGDNERIQKLISDRE